jgi:PadR family transcriptional regulator PadR
MGKDHLGELEELILTVVGILGNDAYGNAVVKEIKAQVNRNVSLAGVHVTLYSLEDKGYVRSRVGGASKLRGGRRKRLFTITNAGLSILKSMNEDRKHLWKLLPQLK